MHRHYIHNTGNDHVDQACPLRNWGIHNPVLPSQFKPPIKLLATNSTNCQFLKLIINTPKNRLDWAVDNSILTFG